MNNIGAVIITYEPGDGLLLALEKLSQQVNRIYLIDNGSVNFSTFHSLILSAKYADKMIFICNDSNLGIGVSLNIGCQAAIDDGFDFVVTFDQDSLVGDNCINNLLDTYNVLSSRHKISLVGTNLQLDDTGIFAKQIVLNKFGFIRIIPKDDAPVRFLITLGCLTNLRMWKEMGGFREDFFIDYVDTEFCLRCLKNEYKHFISSKVILYIQLGNKSEHKLLVKPVSATNHSSLRRYYIARNSIHMLKLYGSTFPSWVLFEFYSLAMTYIKILLFQRNKFLKTKMMLRGWIDGFKGKFGLFGLSANLDFFPILSD